MNYKQRVKEIFVDCGLSTRLKGVKYIADAVEYIDVDYNCDILMDEVYSELAYKYNSTPVKIQQNMKYAFRKALESKNEAVVKKYLTASSIGNKVLVFHLYSRIESEGNRR